MWMLRTPEDAKQPFIFRIVPGNIKTIGRAPRADFVVDAALVSRLHCRLAAGAGEIERSGALDLSSFLARRFNAVFVNEIQNNPFQPDLQFRGFTASPSSKVPVAVLPARSAASPHR